MAPYAKKPGAYSLVISSSKSHIKPGDTASLRIFISGYGFIRQPKLRIQPPSEFFVEKESNILFDLGPEDGGSIVTWGKTCEPLLEDGITISLVGGITKQGWEEPTFIIDEGNANIIFTEFSTKGKAPIELNLKTRDSVRPGTHTATFVLTYYNGRDWVVQHNTYSFQILSWYERNQVPVWVSGIVVTLILFLITLVADHHGIFTHSATHCMTSSR
ncbi:MAG TPA: hypothetical protein VKQ34_04625 [Candidatus Saccharimonadales bacterium]|nr:hypothetical protein [Candidatus Saccharimonadales bacterium]